MQDTEYKIQNVTSETGLLTSISSNIYKPPNVFNFHCLYKKPRRLFISFSVQFISRQECFILTKITIWVSPVMQDTAQCPTHHGRYVSFGMSNITGVTCPLRYRLSTWHEQLANPLKDICSIYTTVRYFHLTNFMSF